VQLHHVAYVTKSIEQKAQQFREILGIESRDQPVVDPTQGVRILFLDLGGTLLELLEPLGPDSPVFARAKKSPGLFHLCFEVDDLDGTLRGLLDSEKAALVKEPLPAPAIDNRRVAFVVTTGNDLIEFVERRALEED
jgi:methylmalonyl-CoA/ethylmalonyl-CoA epimerase